MYVRTKQQQLLLWEVILSGYLGLHALYLGDLHGSDVCVGAQCEVCVCVKVCQAELRWCELHCCHLVAVMGTHHMLWQDHHWTGAAHGQQLKTGAPLRRKKKTETEEQTATFKTTSPVTSPPQLLKTLHLQVIAAETLENEILLKFKH